jgi:hypothetical protein
MMFLAMKGTQQQLLSFFSSSTTTFFLLSLIVSLFTVTATVFYLYSSLSLSSSYTLILSEHICAIARKAASIVSIWLALVSKKALASDLLIHYDSTCLVGTFLSLSILLPTIIKGMSSEPAASKNYYCHLCRF